jgi:hypothetical protein
MTVITEESKEDSQGAGLCTDPNTRRVLEWFVRNPRKVIEPEILPTDEIHYPILEKVLEKVKDGDELLSRMTASGVLVAERVDQAILCPECGSKQISTRYLCVKCYSTNIVRSFLYEHLKCGKVANDDVFTKEGQLICPKCQTVLHNFGVEYRAVGAWYKCNDCAESFNLPVHSHFCRPHKHQFDLEKLRLSPILRYRLNHDRFADIRQQVSLYRESLVILEKHGLRFKAPQELMGKSGNLQTFDIVVTLKGHWRGDRTVSIDIEESGSPITQDAVREFAGKVNDSRPAESYLMAVPGLSEEAKTLARKLKVNFVEAASVSEGTESLMGRGSFKNTTHS